MRLFNARLFFHRGDEYPAVAFSLQEAHFGAEVSLVLRIREHHFLREIWGHGVLPIECGRLVGIGESLGLGEDGGRNAEWSIHGAGSWRIVFLHPEESFERTKSDWGQVGLGDVLKIDKTRAAVGQDADFSGQAALVAQLLPFPSFAFLDVKSFDTEAEAITSGEASEVGASVWP